MASKSKCECEAAATRAAKAKNRTPLPENIWALVVANDGYFQKRFRQVSNIRGFYGTRFMEGQHHWPYDSYTPAQA
jgi:hypothetical protein